MKMKSQLKCFASGVMALMLLGCGKINTDASLQHANELNACAYMTQISSSEFIYQMEQGKFAQSLQELSNQLKPELAAANSPSTALQLYYYGFLPTGDVQSFCAFASPAPYGIHAKSTYIALSDGSIHSKDLKGAPISKIPRDPKAEGWVLERPKNPATKPPPAE